MKQGTLRNLNYNLFNRWNFQKFVQFKNELIFHCTIIKSFKFSHPILEEYYLIIKLTKNLFYKNVLNFFYNYNIKKKIKKVNKFHIA